MFAIANISIHALREEGDSANFVRATIPAVFQSTPSARRATDTHHIFGGAYRFQSTPSARRATGI